MTQLLISVRNVSEAMLIPLRQVGILDIKEPKRGGLGKADNQTITEIDTHIGGQVPVSAALGELIDCDPRDLIKLPSLEFAKFGLSQLANVEDWKTLWRSRIEQLPRPTRPVAVIYADWQFCQAPSPEAILDAARELQCAAVLVDTFDKTAGNVFSRMTWPEIDRLCKATQRAGLKFVLAGGINRSEDMGLARKISPDLIGIRGAVCDRERTGTIAPESLNIFLERFSETFDKTSIATTS